MKLYATTSVISDACYFRKDYSHSINSKCLDCAFCYRKTISKTKERRYPSRWIETEAGYSKELYSAPVVVSRYCEPFFNETYKNHSLHVAKDILANNGQVIFKTVDPCEEAIELRGPNVQIQLRLVSGSFGDLSREVQKLIAPGFPDPYNMLTKNKRLKFTDTVIIDPIIVGINTAQLPTFVKMLYDTGIRKIILKQLFATQQFKSFIAKHMDGKFVTILSEQVGKYWTYRNDVLLYHLTDFLKECMVYNVTPSFCMNKDLNELAQQVIGHPVRNCCQFENPIGYYDPNVNVMDRSKPRVISLKDMKC